MNTRIILALALAAGTLGTLLSSSAFAQESGSSTTATPSKMRVAAQVEVLPVGTGKTTIADTSMSSDAAVAYGISGTFDYALTPYLSIGAAPRLILNVTPDDADDDVDADKAIDLRARILGHYPVAKGLELYASLSPGYTVMLSGDDNVENASGFALGGAVGVTYDVSPKLFLGGEVGYQRAFTSTDIGIGPQKVEAELELSYMHIGIGAGTRF
jgi:outer membrane protein W